MGVRLPLALHRRAARDGTGFRVLQVRRPAMARHGAAVPAAPAVRSLRCSDRGRPTVSAARVAPVRAVPVVAVPAVVDRADRGGRIRDPGAATGGLGLADSRLPGPLPKDAVGDDLRQLRHVDHRIHRRGNALGLAICPGADEAVAAAIRPDRCVAAVLVDRDSGPRDTQRRALRAVARLPDGHAELVGRLVLLPRQPPDGIDPGGRMALRPARARDRPASDGGTAGSRRPEARVDGVVSRCDRPITAHR